MGKTLDLNGMSVIEMDVEETKEVNGGSKGGIWLAIADAICDYLDGLSDGYNDFKERE